MVVEAVVAVRSWSREFVVFVEFLLLLVFVEKQELCRILLSAKYPYTHKTKYSPAVVGFGIERENQKFPYFNLFEERLIFSLSPGIIIKK